MIVKSLLALLLTENTKSRHFTRYFSVRLFSVPPLPSFDFGIGRLFSVRHFSVSYFTCSTYFCFDIFRVAIQLFVLFSLSYFLVQSLFNIFLNAILRFSKTNILLNESLGISIAEWKTQMQSIKTLCCIFCKHHIQ